jgi:hypothetical protein
MKRNIIIILYQEGEKTHGKKEQKLKKLCKAIYSKLRKEANQSLLHTHELIYILHLYNYTTQFSYCALRCKTRNVFTEYEE